MLTKAGHDVATPLDADLMGDSDTLQMTLAVRDNRVCLTKNADDFEALHNLIVLCGGSHPGRLTVRSNNDRRRDMKPGQIVNALTNLTAVITSVRDHVFCLNDWR